MSDNSDKKQDMFLMQERSPLPEDDDTDSTSAIMALGNLWADITMLPTDDTDINSNIDSSGDGEKKAGSTFRSRLDSYKEQLRTSGTPRNK